MAFSFTQWKAKCFYYLQIVTDGLLDHASKPTYCLAACPTPPLYLLHSNQTVLQFLEHINHFTCLEPCICCPSNMNGHHPDTCRAESSPSSDFCCKSFQRGSQILQTTANSHCQSLFPSPQPSSPYHHLTHYKLYLLDYFLLSIQ